jgi:aprataxin
MQPNFLTSHLHLHVISSDLCGADMEEFLQYNGFRPGIRLFLPIDQVLAWFDGTYSNYRKREYIHLNIRYVWN